MRIYVASSFLNIPEVRAVMDTLQRAGHSITWDWTNDCLQGDWTPEQQDAYLQVSGSKDFNGVCAADVLVLVNHPQARDAMTEMGIALGMGTAVFVLYPERRNSVFFHRATLCRSIPELMGVL